MIGCTLAGIAHDEIVDGYATALALHHRLLGNPAYANLPRKYKISVTGCSEDCARVLINDVALSGAIAADGRRGFNLRVGGGLSAQPRFARWVDVFLTPEETTEVVEHVTAIFRDAEENRRARGKARLKFLLDRTGPEGFREQLEQRVGRPLARGAAHAPDLQGHDHIGVTPQRDGAHSAVGLCVPIGRLRSEQLRGVISLAREYGTGEVRLTHQQNVLVPHVPDEHVREFLAEPLVRDELRADPPLFTRGVQTCTGKEFCGLAKVFTKERAAEITTFLNEHVRAKMIEAMDIRIGGRLGPDARFGEIVVKKVPHWELNAKLLEVFDLYDGHHRVRESFREFAARTASGWRQQRLATPEPVQPTA